MDRTASRLRDAARLGLIGAIALLLALSRTTIASANSDVVLVCHGTGSQSNEIVIIRVDSSGLNGHEIEELALTYDCQPAGGGSGGGGSGGDSIDGGSGGSIGDTSSGSGSGSGSGSTSGGSSGPSPDDRPGSGSGGLNGSGGVADAEAARIVGAAGIGPAGTSVAAAPQGFAVVVGGARFVVPATDTLARFLANSSTGQQLGFGLTAFAGIGFLLLLLFGSLARRRM